MKAIIGLKSTKIVNLDEMLKAEVVELYGNYEVIILLKNGTAESLGIIDDDLTGRIIIQRIGMLIDSDESKILDLAEIGLDNPEERKRWETLLDEKGDKE